MTTWFVRTPSYPVSEYVEHMLAQVYDCPDYAEIQAETRREAVSLAVKRWLAEGYGQNYVQSRRSDGLCPFTGVRAQSEVEMKTETRDGGPPDWQPDLCDIGGAHVGATHWVWVDSHPDPDLRWGWFGTCDAHDPSRLGSAQ